MHVLPHLLCPRAFSKTHNGATYPVCVDADRFDNAHLVAGVVVHEQRPARREAAQAHGRGGVVQHLNAPPAFVGCLAAKCQLCGAGVCIDLSALKRQGALYACAWLDGFGGGGHGAGVCFANPALVKAKQGRLRAARPGVPDRYHLRSPPASRLRHSPWPRTRRWRRSRLPRPPHCARRSFAGLQYRF